MSSTSGFTRTGCRSSPAKSPRTSDRRPTTCRRKTSKLTRCDSPKSFYSRIITRGSSSGSLTPSISPCFLTGGRLSSKEFIRSTSTKFPTRTCCATLWSAGMWRNWTAWPSPDKPRFTQSRWRRTRSSAWSSWGRSRLIHVASASKFYSMFLTSPLRATRQWRQAKASVMELCWNPASRRKLSSRTRESSISFAIKARIPGNISIL